MEVSGRQTEKFIWDRNWRHKGNLQWLTQQWLKFLLLELLFISVSKVFPSRFWSLILTFYILPDTQKQEVDVQETESGKRFGGLFSLPDLHLRFRVWSSRLLSLKWWSVAVCPQPKFTSPPQLPAHSISSTGTFLPWHQDVCNSGL